MMVARILENLQCSTNKSGFYSSVSAIVDFPCTRRCVATILDFMGKRDTPMETFTGTSTIDRLARKGFVEKLYGNR